MTVGDLIRGAWTWWELLKVLAPVVVLTGSSFWAGYGSGYNAALRNHFKPSEPPR